ncbi:MAG: hypothetical protein CMJ46_16675 [Planctomyces sp.]|nr:hypothetical protein [Planctomyces sp.]
MKRLLFICCLTLALFTTGLLSVASACPMCKEANETESALPKAYMYSILFMISMPAIIFTGFGVKFYQLTRERDEEETLDDAESTNE